MKMPKYKPTKWKVKYCLGCKHPVGKYSYCERREHNVIERENVPFYVPDMRITGLGYKGWAYLSSEKMNEEWNMSPSNLETIVLNYGVGLKGALPNRWWMWCKVGSAYSLKQVVDEDEEG